MENARPVNLVIHAVNTFENDKGEQKNAWRQIGAAFPHKKDLGFNLLFDLMPWAGQELVLAPHEDDREVAPIYDQRLIVYAVKKFTHDGVMRDFWTRVGVGFPNKLGGFNLKLELLPLLGQDLVMRPVRSDDQSSEAA